MAQRCGRLYRSAFTQLPLGGDILPRSCWSLPPPTSKPTTAALAPPLAAAALAAAALAAAAAAVAAARTEEPSLPAVAAASAAELHGCVHLKSLCGKIFLGRCL